jgi:hypothetical protein
MNGRIGLRNPTGAWHRRMVLMSALQLRLSPVGISFMSLMTIPSWKKGSPDLNYETGYTAQYIKTPRKSISRTFKADVSVPLGIGRGNFTTQGLLKPFNEEHLKSDGDQCVAISLVPFSLDQRMATLVHFALEREDS